MAQIHMNEESPYIAKDGAVSELGQPTSRQDPSAAVGTQAAEAHHGSGAPDQTRAPGYEQQHAPASHQVPPQVSNYEKAPGYEQQHAPASHQVPPQVSSYQTAPGNVPGNQHAPGAHSQEQHAPYPQQAPPQVPGPGTSGIEQQAGDRGLHFGGKDQGAYSDTSKVDAGTGARHPLEATHDVNIGHGHEPLQHSKPGVGDKMRHTMQGVKDVVGGHKERRQTPEGEYHQPNTGGKLMDAVTGQKPGHGTATGYATAGSMVPGEEDYTGRTRPGDLNAGTHQGWPQPVAPPGMSKPNVEAPGVPSQVEPHHHDRHPEQQQQHPGEVPATAAASDAMTGRPEEKQHGVPLSSTPTEEANARHDIPNEQNTVGAEYVDPHGKLHQEGPRDDNVKKEGLMSKLMDKLHISSGKKHKHKSETRKSGSEPATPTAM